MIKKTIAMIGLVEVIVAKAESRAKKVSISRNIFNVFMLNYKLNKKAVNFTAYMLYLYEVNLLNYN